MKMKIGKIKFYHSVKCSTKPGVRNEYNYLDETSGYSVSIDGTFIKIESSDKEVVYTTVSNVVFFTPKLD